jgi:hypothetical protein
MITVNPANPRNLVAACKQDAGPRSARGGRPCLDLTATVGERRGRRAERLRIPQDLASWLVEAGLADELPAASRQDLAQARTLREAVYQTIKRRIAGQRPGPGDWPSSTTGPVGPRRAPGWRPMTASCGRAVTPPRPRLWWPAWPATPWTCSAARSPAGSASAAPRTARCCSSTPAGPAGGAGAPSPPAAPAPRWPPTGPAAPA